MDNDSIIMSAGGMGMGTKVYFFKGSSYIRYDRGDDKVDDGYSPPPSIGDNWSGTLQSGFDSGIDTAVNWGNGTVYFFSAGSYISYNIAEDKVNDDYLTPQSIGDRWPGMRQAGFDSGLDAALIYGNGFAYFFKGDKYVRYSISEDKVDDAYLAPPLIGDGWPGMREAGFDRDLDAAIAWGNGKIYFFKGDRYVRYDIAGDRVEDGYPRSIAEMWPGMGNAGFGAGIDAAIDLLNLNEEIWLPGAEVRRKSPVGPKYRAMPWRGVLHTTEGGSLSGADQTFDKNRDWPHLAIEPSTRTVVQYIPLNVGSRALADGNGTLATNSAHAVQIEIVGFAEKAPQFTTEQLQFIKDVMRQIEDLVPIPRTADRSFLDASGVNRTPGNRMTVQEWAVFSGWCGHQHVPGQTHWDPGAIDIGFLLGP